MRLAISAALFLASLVHAATENAEAPSRTDSRAQFCAGFQITEEYFVSTAHCAVNTNPTNVVVIGDNQVPVVLPIKTLKALPPYGADTASKWSFNIGQGELTAPIAVNTSSIVFAMSAFSRPDQLWRYDIREKSMDAAANTSASDTPKDDSNNGLTVARVKVQAMENAPCELAAGITLPRGVLCGAVDWTSVEKCADAFASVANDRQLIAIEQAGVEYAFGFVSETFPCDEHGQSLSAITVIARGDGSDTSSGASGSNDESSGSSGGTNPPSDGGSNATGSSVSAVDEQAYCFGYLTGKTLFVATAHCAINSPTAKLVVVGEHQLPIVLPFKALKPLPVYGFGVASNWSYNLAEGTIDTAIHPSFPAIVFDNKLAERANFTNEAIFHRFDVRVKTRNHTFANSSLHDPGDYLVLTQTTTSIVGNEKCEAATGVLLPIGVRCGETKWTSVNACLEAAAIPNDHQVITFQQDEREYAFGFVSESFPCNQQSSSNLYIITAFVLLSSDGSASQPPGGESNSGSNAIEPPEYRVISDEIFQSSIRYPFAYISDTLNASTQSVAAVLICSTFVVANADWVQDAAQLKWVLFEDDKIAVKAVSFEEDARNTYVTPSSYLVVVELERPYTRAGIQQIGVELAVFLPPTEDKSQAFEFRFLDPVLLPLGLPADHASHLATLGLCGLSDAATDQDGVYCIRSSFENINAPAIGTPSRMGFVLYDDKLVGIQSGSTKLTGFTSQRFLHFGFWQRRNFITSTTRVSIFWNEYNVFSPAELMQRSAVIRFFGGGKFATCGGMLISPSFVLTTASCFTSNEVLFTSFGSGKANEVVAVQPDDIVIHPQYQKSNGTIGSRFDFAILKLQKPYPASSVIGLAPSQAAVGSDVVRVDLSDAAGADQWVVLNSDQCVDSLAYGSNGIICAGSKTVSVPDPTKMNNRHALVGDYNGNLMLFGFEAGSPGNHNATTYASVLEATSFVKANVMSDFCLFDCIADKISQASLRPPFAYLSSSMNVSSDSVAAAHISADVMVTNAEWISDVSSLKWAIFGHDKIRVDKVVFERDFFGNALPNSSLAVILLQRIYTSPSLPSSSSTSGQLEMTFLDPVLLESGTSENIRTELVASQSCGLDDVAGVKCVQSQQSVTASAQTMSVKMGFVTSNEKVVGVRVGSKTLNKEINESYIDLDFSLRKMLLGIVSELSRGPSYDTAVVRFIEDSKLINCGGMLIAPEFVLTTATCVLSHPNIVGIVHKGEDKGNIVEILRDGTVIHPGYEPTSEGMPKFNVALIKLGRPLPQASAVALAPSQQFIGTEVVRVDLSGPNDPMGAEVKSCDGDDRKRLASGMICIKSSNTITSSNSAALVGTFDNETITLVGLQVKEKLNIYAAVSEAANFINGFTYGQVWGKGVAYNPSTTSNAVVGLRITKTGQNFCGGALIAPQFVLTAAHCVSDGLVNWVSVRPVNSRGEDEVISVKSKSIRIHPSFQQPNMYSFDAAIIELDGSPYGTPMVLDASTDFSDGELARMYGYGTAMTSSSAVAQVQELTLPLWSFSKCQKRISSVDNSAFCAGGVVGRDACAGDSGSPVVIDGNPTVLVGLVSSGYGCGMDGMPGLYTRISKIEEWIRTHSVGSKGIYQDTPEPSSSSSSSAHTSSPTPSNNAPLKPAPSSTKPTSSPAPSGLSSHANIATTSPTPDTTVIVSQPVPDISLITKGKVVNFVVGAGDTILASSSLRDLLTDIRNKITLYSSGDLSEIMQVIQTHDALPLNQRTDRFRNASARQQGDTVEAQNDVCSPITLVAGA